MNISIHQPTGLRVEFYRRLNVDSFPRSSSGNTGAWISLTRYYFTAAGYNQADCSDADNIMLQAACPKRLGWLVMCQSFSINSSPKD